MSTARPIPFLSLAVDPSRLFQDLLPWLLGLIGIVVVGAAVMYAIRRMFRGDASGSSDDFSLQDLRDLHARGELSDEEFARAKTAIIGRAQQPSPNRGDGPAPLRPGKPPIA
jgi:hypothetical protein